MAKTWRFDEDSSIELHDFISFMNGLGVAIFDKRNSDVVARMMRKLCNNRLFFAEHLARVLRSDKPLNNNHYKSRVFVVYSCDYFMIRAVVWEPIKKLPDDDMYAYKVCHDHNFDFYTVGYYGPGYRTILYKYNYGEVLGYSKEHVDMTLLEDTTLDYGKVMMYTRNVDIHIQIPPPDLSISINLIGPTYVHGGSMDRRINRQYDFDRENSTIVGRIKSSPDEVLLSIGAAIGGECVKLIENIAEHDASDIVRFKAIESLARRVNRGYTSLGYKDKSRYVQVSTEQLLAELSSLPCAEPRSSSMESTCDENANQPLRA